MNRHRLLWVVLLALGLAAGTLGGCSSSSPPPSSPPASGSASGAPTNGLVQSHSGGNVTIEVKWLGEQSDSLGFQVTMDTHSVDLDQFDLGKLAVLRDDAGREYTPTAWLAPQGGHHRSGNLTFPLPEGLRQGSTRSVQLLIRGVAGVAERALVWQLG